MKKTLIVMVAVSVLVQGCIPALIVGGMVAHSKTKKTRQSFMAEFNSTNAEREAHKLSPLDWCEEVQKFDQGWYKKQKQCPQFGFKKVK